MASYWAGIPGGIFTPALTTGAGIGHHIWQLAGDGVDQRVLVLLSMAAFLAAATQAPLTASVVVMEASRQPAHAVLAAGWGVAGLGRVARQFCPQPFYHLAAGRFRRQALVEAGRAAKPAASPVSGSERGTLTEHQPDTVREADTLQAPNWREMGCVKILRSDRKIPFSLLFQSDS